MKTGRKPIGRLLVPSTLQVLQEAGCDLRTWTITTKLRQILDRLRLTWETVHKYLEQMVQDQMIFRYEDPTGLVQYSKNPIVREKVLFQRQIGRPFSEIWRGSNAFYDSVSTARAEASRVVVFDPNHKTLHPGAIS